MDGLWDNVSLRTDAILSLFQWHCAGEAELSGAAVTAAETSVFSQICLAFQSVVYYSVLYCTVLCCIVLWVFYTEMISGQPTTETH